MHVLRATLNVSRVPVAQVMDDLSRFAIPQARVYKKSADNDVLFMPGKAKAKQQQPKQVTANSSAASQAASSAASQAASSAASPAAAPTPSSSSSLPTASKSTTTRMNLADLQNMRDRVLPGRIDCACQATRHSLLTNCLSCGRIICEQEGPGPCLTCGTDVFSKEQQQRIVKQIKKRGGPGVVVDEAKVFPPFFLFSHPTLNETTKTGSRVAAQGRGPQEQVARVRSDQCPANQGHR